MRSIRKGGYAIAQAVHAATPGGNVLHNDELVCGYVFNTGSLPIAEMLDRLPKGPMPRVPLARRLWPHLMLATAFVPGRLSMNTIAIQRPAADSPPAIQILGASNARLTSLTTHLRRYYRDRFSSVGSVMIPGSFTTAPSGSDVHYGASLPMSEDPATNGTRLKSDILGRIRQTDRIHFIDGAVLPALPSKSHTLTITANASRIAHCASQLD